MKHKLPKQIAGLLALATGILLWTGCAPITPMNSPTQQPPMPPSPTSSPMPGGTPSPPSSPSPSGMPQSGGAPSSGNPSPSGMPSPSGQPPAAPGGQTGGPPPSSGMPDSPGGDRAPGGGVFPDAPAPPAAPGVPPGPDSGDSDSEKDGTGSLPKADGEGKDNNAGRPGGPFADPSSEGAEGDGDWESDSGAPGGWETSNEIPGTPGESQTENGGGGQVTDESGGEGEFETALGEIDGEIMAERATIERRSNESPGTGGGVASSNTDTSGSFPSGSGDSGDTGGNDGRATPAPRGRSAPRPPATGSMPGGPVPDDIPDARDDDIIARQLREAAMQETDPELKEKLWEEYRRYKGR
ncbi:MAG: hypothetical protein QF921_17565 [Pseudomonadales bacterium]|nr:hypothetical protein [Pseudomonadales bacterium]MDP6472879.1 hypothetical protein [Pseudomonadales bacterium]MDP6826365.1 hypothetical protein [Pseudomonadales bacterium]MDP6973295.1 hypothetical protein [Pseudomonadales bacterium]